MFFLQQPSIVRRSEYNRLGYDTSTPVLRYGDRFRKHRRWHHEYVGSKTAFESYRHIQQREVWILLRNFLHTPDAFLKHVYRYVALRLYDIVVQMHDRQIQCGYLAGDYLWQADILNGR